MLDAKYCALLPILKQAKRHCSAASSARHSVDCGSSEQRRKAAVEQAAKAESRAKTQYQKAQAVMSSDLDDRHQLASGICEQIRLLAVSAGLWHAEAQALTRQEGSC